MTQNPRSDAGGCATGAARYFDYASAVALRDLAAAFGTAMPRYLLAPEVALLLSHMPDQRRRLFAETLWNCGGRLSEVLPLTPGDFALDCPATGAPLPSPFVVLRTLKQRGGPSGRRRGRPTRAEEEEVRNNPPRAVPLTDPHYVQRLREHVATARLRKTDRIWNVSSQDTVRSWISDAVSAAAAAGISLSVRPVTPRTFRDSFAMHLVQHQVPQKVLQAMMGHKDAKSTEWYTRVLALDVTRQLGVRFSMDAGEARALLFEGKGYYTEYGEKT